MDNEKKQYSNSRFWTGLFLLGAGSLLLAKKLGVAIPHWMLTWEFFLIALGVFIGFKHNFKNKSWFILIIIGGFFLLENQMPEIGLREYFWPIAIIGLGLLFLLKPKREHGRWSREKWQDRCNEKYGWQKNVEGNNIIMGEHISASDNDTFYIRSVFSGVQKRILSKNFKSGKISCVFGGAEIDFMQADIQGRAELRMDEVFGGVKLLVPQSWTVKNEIDGIFHGVEDKRNAYGSVVTDENKVLVLCGSAVFAGIEIKSY